MAANEISFGNNVPPPVTTISSQDKAPSPAVPKVTVEEVSKVADNKKSRSVNELAENAAEIREAISEINKAVKKVPTSLDFSVDEASKRFVVQVTDTNTGEVIRKLPGDAVLRIARQLESMKGVVFDQKF